MDNDQDVEKPLPNQVDIEALVGFLPTFESPDFVFAEQEGGTRRQDGTITMPHWVLSDEANRFHHVLHERGFIRPFNWVAWKHEAERLVEAPSALAQADLETICKLLTAHVRQERFCEGHLQAIYKRRHLSAILRRLASLAASS